MPLKIRRVLAEVSYPERPGTTITLRDQATQAVLGSTTLDGAGLGTILLPFELYLAAVAGGHAGAGAALAMPGQETGGAGGAAGGSGTLTQSLPIAGGAAGHAGGAASETTGIAGAAGGHAAGAATPSLLDPGQQGGGAGGAGGGSGSLVVSAPLVGGAGGHAAAGSSGIGQEIPIAGAAAGHAAGTGSVSAQAPSGDAQSITMPQVAGYQGADSTTTYNGTNGTFGTSGAATVGGMNDGKGWLYYHAGFMWPNVTPSGAVSSLKFKMQAQALVGGTTHPAMPLKIRAVSNPTTWSASNKPSLAAMSAAVVEWQVPYPSAGAWITTPELSSLLTSVGWSPGGSIAFVVEVSGANASALSSFQGDSGWYFMPTTSTDASNRAVLLINGAT